MNEYFSDHAGHRIAVTKQKVLQDRVKSGTYNELLKIHSLKEPGVNWSLGFCVENSIRDGVS